MRACLFGCVALLSVASCAPSPAMKFQVLIDPSFDLEDIVAAETAARHWELATGGALHLSVAVAPCVEAQDDEQVCVHKGTVAEIVALGGAESFVGFTIRNNNNSDVYMPTQRDAGYSFDQDVEILAHELAHSFSLGHVSEKSELMYPSIQSQVLDISCGDLQQFWDLRLGNGKWAGNTECPHGGSYALIPPP